MSLVHAPRILVTACRSLFVAVIFSGHSTPSQPLVVGIVGGDETSIEGVILLHHRAAEHHRARRGGRGVPHQDGRLLVAVVRSGDDAEII